MAVPTFNGTVSSTTYASRTNTTITAPASIVDGERLLMAFFILNDPIVTPTTPSGWTAVTPNSGSNPIVVADGASNDAGFHLYTKVASSEGASWTVTHASASSQGFVWRTSASSIDVCSARGDSSVANTTRTCDAVTTTGADRLLYYIGFDWANTATGETPPSGFTEVLDNTLSYLAHANQASSGSSGSKTNACNSNSGANPRGGFLLALYEDGGGTKAIPIFHRPLRFRVGYR